MKHMEFHEVLVPVDGGELATTDYGGSGRPMIFIHSPGYSARQWDDVAAGVHAHSWALDLRGHGHSTAPVVRGSQVWRDIVAVADALELVAPVVVAHEMSGAAVLQAAYHAPGRFAAIVLVNASCAASAQAMAEAQALLDEPEILGMLTERFLLGVRIPAPDRATFVRTMIEHKTGDWWLPEVPMSAAETDHITVDHGDGTFSQRPEVAAVQALYSFEPGEEFPCDALHERVEMPVFTVTTDGSFDAASREQIEELARRRPNVHARFIPGGPYPQYANVTDLVAVLNGILTEIAEQ